MKKWILIFLFLIGLSFSLNAEANSAMHYWHGSHSTSLALKDKDCPLEVICEDLDFYIRDLPPYAANKSYLTATYTFYNPTDEEITASLLFPFGRQPDYVDELEWDEFLDYSIKVNDTAVENLGLRYTFSSTQSFSIAEDLKKVKDDYQSNSFFKKELPIYCITYRLSGIGRNTKAKFSLNHNHIQAFSQQFYYYSYSNSYEASSLNSGDKIDIYFVGQRPINFESKIHFYSDDAFKHEIDGTIEAISEEMMTFEDFVFQGYKEEYGVSKIDWYNAFLDRIIENKSISNVYQTTYFYSNLMRWYEYQIVVPAKSSIVNEVNAPLYPDIDSSFEPEVYHFSYLLSPASTWHSFENLTITIHCDFFLQDASIKGFEYDANLKQYILHLDELPNEELTFNLCLEENPKPKQDGIGWLILVLMILIFILSIPVIVMLIPFFYSFKKYRYSERAIKKNLLCIVLEELFAVTILINGFLSSALNYTSFGAILCLALTIGLLIMFVIEKMKFNGSILGRMIVTIVSIIFYMICFIEEDIYWKQAADICMFSILFGVILFIWIIVKIIRFNPEKEGVIQFRQASLPVGYLSNRMVIVQLVGYLSWLIAFISCLAIINEFIWLICILFIFIFICLFILFAILLQFENRKDFRIFYKDLDYDKLEKNVLLKLNQPTIHSETKNYYLMMLANVAIVFSLEHYIALKKQIFVPRNKLYLINYNLSSINWLLNYEELLKEAQRLRQIYEKKKRVIKAIDQFVNCWEFYYKKTSSEQLEKLVPYNTKNEYLNAIHLFIQIHHYKNLEQQDKVLELLECFKQKYSNFRVLKDKLDGVDVGKLYQDLCEEENNKNE